LLNVAGGDFRLIIPGAVFGDAPGRVRPLRGWRDNHHCEGRCPSRSPGYFYQNHIDLAGRHRARARRANCPCESGHADAAIAGRRSIRRASARRDDSAVAGRRHTGSQAAPRVRICVVIRVRNRASRWRGSIAVDRLIRSADNQHMRSQRVRFYEQKWIRFRERRGLTAAPRWQARSGSAIAIMPACRF